MNRPTRKHSRGIDKDDLMESSTAGEAASPTVNPTRGDRFNDAKTEDSQPISFATSSQASTIVETRDAPKASSSAGRQARISKYERQVAQIQVRSQSSSAHVQSNLVLTWRVDY